VTGWIPFPKRHLRPRAFFYGIIVLCAAVIKNNWKLFKKSVSSSHNNCIKILPGLEFFLFLYFSIVGNISNLLHCNLPSSWKSYKICLFLGNSGRNIIPSTTWISLPLLSSTNESLSPKGLCNSSYSFRFSTLILVFSLFFWGRFLGFAARGKNGYHVIRLLYTRNRPDFFN